MKHSLLVINSSARVERSVTRRLTDFFASRWQAIHPDGEIIRRDVGTAPPPFVDEAWIRAAFRGPGASADPALAVSETLIDELARATTVVIGAPMYNFGMPAALKAWLDQVVRVGRTFAFDAEAESPYSPLLTPKPVVLITSTGDAGYEPGGRMARFNFLDPHLTTALGFLGLKDVSVVRAAYDEFQDGRAQRSLAGAEEAIDRLLAGREAGAAA